MSGCRVGEAIGCCESLILLGTPIFMTDGHRVVAGAQNVETYRDAFISELH